MTSPASVALLQPSDVTADVTRDVAHAAAIVSAAEGMHAASDLATLWSRVAEEAVELVDADGVAVVDHRRGSWHLLTSRSGPTVLGDAATAAEIERVGSHGLLAQPACADDLTRNGFWVGEPWRSLLVVAVEGPSRHDQIRLMWYAARRAAFSHALEVAELFARQVRIALQTVVARDTLTEAVSARHHVGLAQGVLMSRYGINADQAFAVLQQQSQKTNTKLRIIADQVLDAGELPSQS
jgi:hypothetical protein